MKQGDLASGAGKLYHLLKELRQRWADTKEVWDDVTRREFEEKHLMVIDPKVIAALESMSRLQQVLTEAQVECS